jgi:hypothetical protein
VNYAGILVTARALIRRGVFLVDFNAAGEFDACYHLRQLILPIEAAPQALRGLDQFEHHDHAAPARTMRRKTCPLSAGSPLTS